MDLDAVGLAYHLRVRSNFTNNPDNTGYEIYTIMKEELFKLASLGYTSHTFYVCGMEGEIRNKVAALFEKEGLKATHDFGNITIDWSE